MFDLRMSDLILVHRPAELANFEAIAEAFAVVRVLREHGHQHCFVLPDAVVR